MDDHNFIQTASGWLTSNAELLITSAYGAGDRDYLLCQSLDDIRWFCDNTANGYLTFSVCLYADPKLPLRGVVDASFVALAIASMPNDTSILVMRLDPRRDRLLAGNYCDNHTELNLELNERPNCRVAVGALDDWDDFDPRPPEEKRFANATVKRGA